MKQWKTLESEILIQNPWITVKKDKCLVEEGKVIPDYIWFEEKDFSVVFGVTKNKKIVMLEHYRYPFNDNFYEFPSGILDRNGENHLDNIKRELIEESGYKAAEIVFQKEIILDLGRSNKIGYVYFAKGLEKVTSQELDDGEYIKIKLVSFEELQKLIENNDIKCAKTLSVAFLALQKKEWFMGE